MLPKSARVILTCLVLCGITGLAQAQTPDPNLSYANYAAYPSQVSCCIYPNGGGTPLSGCYAFGGQWINATITVTLLDAAGTPIPLFPAVDLRLRTNLGGIVWCPIVITPRGALPGYECIADAPTNAAGRTTFSLSYFGGGQTSPALGEICEVYAVVGTAIIPIRGTDPMGGPPNSQLDIQFNSPDIDANGIVNLTDLVAFATDFYGVYSYRSDYFWDGIINLSDIVHMARAFGATCPP